MNLAEKAEQTLRWVREAPEIVYDAETTGLDWRTDRICGHVIGTEVDGVPTVHYVPIAHGGGGNLPQADRYAKDLAQAFAERDGWIIGHNIQFDANLCYSEEHPIYLGRKMVCTQLAQALLDEHSPSFSLDALSQRYGVTAKKGEDLYKYIASRFPASAAPNRTAMSHFWRLSGNDPMAVEYAEGDGVSTWELWLKQRPLLVEQELQTVARMEFELLWTLTRMEQRGIRIDLAALERVGDQIETALLAAQDKLPEDFNPRSPIHMLKFVRDDLGRDDFPRTEKGNASFTEKYLATFPEGRSVLDLRKWSNLRNTFVTPLKERHVYEGRVHPRLNPTKSDDYGAISGRFSCSNPNLQQVPKRDYERAKLFRTVFVPDEGWRFCERDWSQCEPRLFAHYAREEKLRAGYNATPPEDVHDIVAKMLAIDRQFGKTMNMGIFNGMTAKTLSGHLDVSKAEAQDYLNQWNALFPKIDQFRRAAARRLRDRGYVKTILGRRCRLDNPRFAYKGVSKVIQGSNADIMKYKLLELDRLYEAENDIVQLLGTIHDAVLEQSEDGNPRAVELQGEAKRIMEDVNGEPFNLKVPFVVDEGFGYTWTEASFGAA